MDSFKLAIRFLKENNLLPKYKFEYFTHPNICNSGKILEDLKNATHTYDNSPFHMKTKGFDRSNTTDGSSFWIKVNEDFKTYLRQHNGI